MREWVISTCHVMSRIIACSPMSWRCKSGIRSIRSSRAVWLALSMVAESRGILRAVRTAATSATRGFSAMLMFGCVD